MLLGSSLLRFGHVAAGAVMLRMSRCVSLSSWRLCCVHVCWWVSHAHACGGLVVVSVMSLSVLPFLFPLVFSSSLLSLSLFLSQPQPVESHTTCQPDLGEDNQAESPNVESGLYAVGLCSGSFCYCESLTPWWILHAGTLGYML